MLHLKYRPKTLNEIIGNRGVKQSLSKLLENKETLPHTFLFSGEAGTGKTTLGRIIAKEIGCNETEIREINSADTRGIDFARSIIQDSLRKPLYGSKKVFILDEIHMQTTEAMNSLLKILEEPPKHTYFILCTTDPNKLINTIRTRCYQYTTSKLTSPDLIELLHSVMKQEDFTISPEMQDIIVDLSDGVPRTALVLLGMLKDVKSIEDALDIAYNEISNTQNISELGKMLINSSTDWGRIMGLYNKSYKELDPDKLRITLFSYYGGWLKNANYTEIPKLTGAMEILKIPLSAPYSHDLILRFAQIFKFLRSKNYFYPHA